MKESKQIRVSSSQQWRSTCRSLRCSDGKQFKINFIDNTLDTDVDADPSRELSRAKQQMENADEMRYMKFKESMKTKFFKIKTVRERALKKPKLSISPLKLSEFKLEDDSQLAINPQINYFNEVSKILESIAATKKEKQAKISMSRSEIEKKSKSVIQNERKTIMKFIKKSSSVSTAERRWSDLSNKQKYIMDFSMYIHKKNQSKIDKHIYESRVRKKTKNLEKFQDFILTEVKFSNDHREKLSKVFSSIRSEFERAERSRNTGSVRENY